MNLKNMENKRSLIKKTIDCLCEQIKGLEIKIRNKSSEIYHLRCEEKILLRNIQVAKNKVMIEKGRLVMTKKDKEILKVIPEDYKWIARNKNGNLIVFKEEPIKRVDYWIESSYDESRKLKIFNDYFKFIQFEDERAYMIADLKKK